MIMQIYRKVLVLFLLSAAAVSASGCSISESKETQSTDTELADTQNQEEPANMILLNNILYYDTQRTVSVFPGYTDGTIQSVTAANTTPVNNGEANFDCQGKSYSFLADGAIGLITDETARICELFLADDTVEFQGVYKKKKELSKDTLKWLNFYYTLSESDRNALSMIPSEFAGQISGTSAATKETSTSGASYLESLTQEDLDTTEALAQHYFTEEVTSFEGVDQIYPADSSDPQYHNSGIEEDYSPGNIIIYRVLTNLDRRDGNPFRYISIARKSKSDDWKIINSGF